MNTYTIDTNAGPIHTIEAENVDAVKAFVERHVPILHEPGNSGTWTHSGDWFVLNVFDANVEIVHACAFRPGGLT